AGRPCERRGPMLPTGLSLTRRQMLRRAAGGFGALALAGIWAEAEAAATGPLDAKPGHFPAKADRVIFLFSTGGTSHVDTFDYKPKLFADHGKSVTVGRWLAKNGAFPRF